MEPVFRVINVVVSFMILVFGPFCAVFLGRFLKATRDGVDKRINWRGKHAETFEKIEDGVTTLMAIGIGILAMLLTGAVWMKYVQEIAWPTYHTWLYDFLGAYPNLDLPILGSANLGLVLYWVFLFGFTFALGWISYSPKQEKAGEQ